MKPFRYIVAVLLPLLLTTTIAWSQVPAQTFLLVDYMQVDPNMVEDYVQLEEEVWMPFHQYNINNGKMLAWSLYNVRFDVYADYDYVTVNAYDNLAAMDTLDYWGTMALVHPEADMDSLFAATDAARTIVRSEVWVMVDQTSNQKGAPGPVLEVDFMRVPPTEQGEYERVEREVWKPMHAARQDRGLISYWGLYDLVFPGGTDYGHNYSTVNAFKSLADIPFSFPNQILNTAHPDTTWSDILPETLGLRDMARSEIWMQVLATE
jgi:L-rhamnose mutarotase